MWGGEPNPTYWAQGPIRGILFGRGVQDTQSEAHVRGECLEIFTGTDRGDVHMSEETIPSDPTRFLPDTCMGGSSDLFDRC